MTTLFPQAIEKERRFDWTLTMSALALMVIGAFFILSASTVNDPNSRLVYKQILFYAVGLTMAGVLCLVDYATLAARRFWWSCCWWTSFLLHQAGRSSWRITNVTVFWSISEKILLQGMPTLWSVSAHAISSDRSRTTSSKR